MEDLKHKKIVVGIKETKNAARDERAQIVYVAGDAELRLVQPIRDLCALSGIPCIEADSRKALAKACGVDVPTAAAAVLNE